MLSEVSDGKWSPSNVNAFVPYSVTVGCSLTGTTHGLLRVLCCLTVVTFKPGILQALQSYSWEFAMIQSFRIQCE